MSHEQRHAEQDPQDHAGMISLLDARSLTEFQACRRKFVLDHDWRVVRWRPKALFDACLRKAIVALSSGADPVATASAAKTQFMQTAAAPGIETAYPAYQVAKDYCAMLDTIVRSLARLTLLTMSDVPPQPLTTQTSWRFSSTRDESGTLHRWITVDHWGDADLYREIHSWWTMGDMVVARAPMELHVIEIGQERAGRRMSPWARAWQHPGLPRLQLRFKRKDGKSFQGWKPVWLADDAQNDPGEWVDRMWAEGAAEELVHRAIMNMPSERTVEDTRRQILTELTAMDGLIERSRGGDERMLWRIVPMSRGACDGMVPCPFQDACFTETKFELGELGLYQRRIPPTSHPARDTKQYMDRAKVSTVVV